jgi:hypothetical protein
LHVVAQGAHLCTEDVHVVESPIGRIVIQGVHVLVDDEERAVDPDVCHKTFEGLRAAAARGLMRESRAGRPSAAVGPAQILAARPHDEQVNPFDNALLPVVPARSLAGCHLLNVREDANILAHNLPDPAPLLLEMG